MARSFSLTSLRALLTQETEEVFVMLATLNHPALTQPLRVTSDLNAVISRDPVTGFYRNFLPWRFDIQFPNDSGTELPRAQAVIDNISPEIGAALQSLANQPTSAIAGGNTLKVTIEFVRVSDPDTIEASWDNLTMRTVHVDDTSVSGTLTYEDILSEPLAATITPATVPGVFGANN